LVGWLKVASIELGKKPVTTHASIQLEKAAAAIEALVKERDEK